MQVFLRAIYARLSGVTYVPGGGSGLAVTNDFFVSMGGRIRAIVAPSNS